MRKTTKGWNLKKKRVCIDYDAKGRIYGYYEEDIREFIKRLKEEIFECDMVMDEVKVNEIIDKLVGQQLSEKIKEGEKE